MELDAEVDYGSLRAREEEDEEEDDQEDADICDMIATLMFLTIDKSGPDIADVD